jgi:CRP-like cAMP-binding protein
MGTSRAYEPGEMIFGPSPDPEHVFVLDEGLVRIYSVGPEGHEITLGYVRPGELFGELAVVSDKARESFARAARPWRVLRIPKERFLETRL